MNWLFNSYKMKKIFCVIFLVTLWGCGENAKKASPLINFIPQSAGVIVKVPQFEAFENALRENSFKKANSDLSFFNEVEKKLHFLDFLNLKNPSLLTFSTEGRSDIAYTFITKETTGLVSAEGIKTVRDSVSYEGYYIKTAVSKGQEHFFTILDSVFVLSESKLILENIIRQKDLPVPADLLKTYNTASNKTASIIFNHKKADELVNSLLPQNNFFSLKKFARWSALDIEVAEGSIKLNGISTYSETEPQLLKIFQNVGLHQTETSQVTPLNAESLYSFTFRDFETLKKNIDDYHTNREPIKVEKSDFFSLATEIGVISFKNEKALVVNTSSIIESQDQLLDENVVEKNYRETNIYQFSKGNIFKEVLNPLVNLRDLNFYTILDHFIIFAEKVETLEHIIANVQNETILAKQEFFQNSMASLSSESSLLLIAINKNIKDEIAAIAPEEHAKELKNRNFSQYPISALQFIKDDDFAHVHAVLEKSTGKSQSGGLITQTAATSLENRLVTDPVIFTNHLNNQKEIVVQDEQNILYLISNSGSIIWKKQLEGPILGEVQQVDLYKNNKYQLAFATQNKFNVLDRNGNEVKPFPIKLNKKITQPLAVFDYDNNRNYRFVIVQGDDLTMYNSDGKVVSGFKFKRANGEITKAPKHIRIGKKDYILIADASGKLHIIDRQGNPRVKVSEKIAFSPNEWFLYKDRFASTNAEGDLLLINEKGEVKKEQLNLNENHQIEATEKTLVSVSENVLKIKDQQVEMDYGIFSKPKIFYLKDKIYVSVTDLQSHKVYLYDSNGEMLPNFSVYGNSAISLGNFDADKNLEFAVQGEESSILFYEIN